MSLVTRKPKNRAGQAVVEYILMLAVAVSLIGLLSVGFHKSIFAIWRGFTKQIAAACPGCPPNPNATF